LYSKDEINITCTEKYINPYTYQRILNIVMLNIVIPLSLLVSFLVTSFGSDAVAQPTIGNVTTSVSLPPVPTGCQMQDDGLPDSNCTPGELNPEVSESNIQSTICVPGWSTHHARPPTSYTNPLKTELMKSYALDPASRVNYELDHLIALSLGGNPTSAKNLWPEPYDIQYNAHIKDAFENYLHHQVCNGSISLSYAQRELSQDWITNSLNDQHPSEFIAVMIPTNGGSFNLFNPGAENLTDEDDNAK
jgi:hypothetical protein